MTISCQNDYFSQIQGILTVFCIINPSCWLSKALKTTPYSIFPVHIVFSCSPYSESIPNESRTDPEQSEVAGYGFLNCFSIGLRLFLDRSSIVSRSFFVRPSMVLRSTIVHPSFSLRSFFDCRTKIYRRSIEEIANKKRSYY